jgi:hypothetical protein
MLGPFTNKMPPLTLKNKRPVADKTRPLHNCEATVISRHSRDGYPDKPAGART